MHALFVCLIPPFPPHDGMRLRTWNLLVPLAEDIDVSVLAWALPEEPPEHLDKLRELGELIVLPKAPAVLTRSARLRRQARFLFGAPPPFVQEGIEERALHSSTGMRRVTDAVADLHRRRPIDVVVFEDEETRSLPFPDLGVPFAVHKLTVFQRVLADLRRHRGWHRVAWLFERRGWRRFDRDAVRDASLIIATTPETVVELSSIAPRQPVAVVTNGVEPRAKARPGGDVAFIGSMDRGPNIDALQWLVDEIWPELHRRFPDCRLRVIGANPRPAVLALAGNGVEIVGEVPDLVDACDGVGVGLVPLRGGMGIKNKTLDLMAMGLPVVATPWGAEGIDADEAGLVVASAPDAFVESVAALLTDPDRSRELGERGRAYIERHHSWDEQARRFRAALEACADRGRVG
jgi:glycosyltransferase involved in cell wall biosynthesis